MVAYLTDRRKIVIRRHQSGRRGTQYGFGDERGYVLRTDLPYNPLQLIRTVG